MMNPDYSDVTKYDFYKKLQNLTSRTYNEFLADEIFARIHTYVPMIKEMINRISQIIGK